MSAPATCTVGTGVFSRGKAAGREVDRSPASGAKFEIVWSYAPRPSVCLHGMARTTFFFPLSFYFYLIMFCSPTVT